MNIVKKLRNSAIDNKAAVRFVLLLFVAYSILYITNYVFTAALQKGGLYNEWLDKNLDYITAFRTFLLTITAKLLSLFHYETYLTENILYVKGGQNIRMVYLCMGINILC